MPLTKTKTIAVGLAFACVGSTFVGCETYDSPPRPQIHGLVEGALADPAAPIIIAFSEPVVEKSVRVQVVKLVTDAEGNLGDEDEDPSTQLQSFFANDPVTANTFGGSIKWSDDRTTLRLDLTDRLPIGPSLAVIIEPGLSDDEGREQKVRERLVFSYRLDCESSGGATTFPSGTYFLIANVTKPIETQIQLFGVIDVNPETGQFNGQFTNADRIRDANRCSPPCAETEACRLIPAEACVPPSEKVASENEFPDFEPNPTPPVGYTFAVGGCVVDDGDAHTFINLPADVDIQQPDVFVAGIQLTASFADDGAGNLRATGSVTAERVDIGTTPSGQAEGTVLGRLIPPDQVPDGIPRP
jgi:hypothetical protein